MGLAVAITVLFLAFTFLLPTWIESRIRSYFHQHGMVVSGLDVQAVTFHGLYLGPFEIGEEHALQVSGLDAAYSLGNLLGQNVREITVTGVSYAIDIRNGDVDWGPIGEWKTPDEEIAGSGRLPFDVVILRSCELLIATEGSTVRLPVSGRVERHGDSDIRLAVQIQMENELIRIGGDIQLAPLSADMTVGLADASSEGSGVSDTLTLQFSYNKNESQRLRVTGSGNRSRIRVPWLNDNVELVDVGLLGSLAIDDFNEVRESDLSVRCGRMATSAMPTFENVSASLTHQQGRLTAVVSATMQDWAMESLVLGLPNNLEKLSSLTAMPYDVTVLNRSANSPVAPIKLRGDMQLNPEHPFAAEGLLSINSGTIELGEYTVENVAALVPLALGRRAAAPPDSRAVETGYLTAGPFRWRDQTLPAFAATMALSGSVLTLDGNWPITSDGGIRVEGLLDLTQPATSVDAHARLSHGRIDEASAIHKLILKLLSVKAGGELTVDATLRNMAGHIDPQVRVRLDETTLVRGEADKQKISGLSLDILFSQLFPLMTDSQQRLAWREGRLGDITLGPADISFSISNNETLWIERAKINLMERGRFWVHAVKVQRDSQRYDLEVFAEDLSLKSWLETLAGDRVTGEGRLYGRVPIEVTATPRLKVTYGEGFLVAEPGGWLRIRDSEEIINNIEQGLAASDAADSSAVRDQSIVLDHVTQALKDYEFSLLRFTLQPEGDDVKLVVLTSGKGRQPPYQQIGGITANINSFGSWFNQIVIDKMGFMGLGDVAGQGVHEKTRDGLNDDEIRGLFE